MKNVMCLSLVVLSLSACNGSSSDNAAVSSGGSVADAAAPAPAPTGERTKYLASNVVFDSSSATSLSMRSMVQRSAASAASVGNGKVDTTTKILASDIVFTDADVPTGKKKLGRLKSKNLKSALQNELAVNVSDTVVGTWDVVNHAPDFDNQPGVVTFNADGTLTLDSGNMEPFYLRNFPISNTYLWGIPSGAITYKMISNGVMLISYFRNGSVQYFAPMVVMDSPSTMTLVLYGTDAGVSASKVAVMKKRITAEEKAAEEAEGLGDDETE